MTQKIAARMRTPRFFWYNQQDCKPYFVQLSKAVP